MSKRDSTGEWKAQSSSQTNRFKDEYFQLDPFGHEWMEDLGWNDSLQMFKIRCKWCKMDLQCRKNTIKDHPKGTSHQRHQRKREAERAARDLFAGAFAEGEAKLKVSFCHYILPSHVLIPCSYPFVACGRE